MLIGIPTSGKSTYVKKLLSMDYVKRAVVLSTDNYIEQIAESRNETYNAVFSKTIKEATSNMNASIELAKFDGLDVIWDQTNLTQKSRKSKLAKFPNYEKSAVIFEISLEEALLRNQTREGKIIPEHILRSMYSSMEYPSITEGFRNIEVIQG